MATPLEADAACTRRWGNGTGRSSAFIPPSVAKGKQEVLGARDTAVASLAQTRGGRCHMRWSRFHPAESLTEHRSTPGPHVNETPNTMRKPDDAVIAKRTCALRATAVRRSTPPRLWN